MRLPEPRKKVSSFDNAVVLVALDESSKNIVVTLAYSHRSASKNLKIFLKDIPSSTPTPRAPISTEGNI